MSEKLTNVTCWNCQELMVPFAGDDMPGWYRCPKCRATEYPNPVTLHLPDIIEVRDEGPKLTRFRPALNRRGLKRPRPT